MLLLLLLVLPFAGSVVALALPADARRAGAGLAGATALAGLGILAVLHGPIAHGEVVRFDLAWVPAFDLRFTLRLDGFAWMFGLLVTGIGFLVVLYARYYLAAEDPLSRFFAFFLAFMGSMLGVVLSGNLVQIAFFWELTSLFSFLLIGYRHASAAARDGARMALVVTSAGGLCLFAGLLVLGRIVGSYDLDRVLASGDLIRGHALYLPALVLVLLGALTKSAQFPFHFWLPQAMVAPTPVSAYLHSAAMVKLGVFLMARLWPAMAGTDEWMWIVSLAGACSLVFGAYAAIFQHDLKGLLAYSTISHLGLITLLLGLNSPLGTVAAIFHTLNHATFKASLFMAAGIIDHETGTRDMRRLGGLRRAMPVTATLAVVAAAAMAGVPLLIGFLSKEMFFAESLALQGPSRILDRLLPYVATLWGVFSVAYSMRLIHSVFFGPVASGLPRTPREPPRWMRFPAELLAFACLVVGILPALTIGPILEASVGSVLGAETPGYSLAVWHGLSLPLAMSTSATIGGIVLYRLLRSYLARGLDRVPFLPSIDARGAFDRALLVVSWRWARGLDALLGTRKLQPQLRWLLVAALLAAAWPAWRLGLHPGPLPWSPVDPAFAIVWAIGGASAVGAAVLAKFHRLAALLLAGGAGLATCLTFVWLAAPDLALTQLLVEIVTTVLLLLGLRWLPKRFASGRTPAQLRAAMPRRLRDVAVAIAAGGGMAALSHAVMTRPLPDNAISRFFLVHAHPEGGGTNVVNVIIVDCRGFDTLGEITVLGVVAIAVYSLLRRFRPARESIGPPTARRGQSEAGAAEDLLVPSLIMRAMFPAIAMLSAYLLLRGHNLPGGGFAAGLVLAVGVILQYMAQGTHRTEERLRIRPLNWMGAGLLLAAATGAGSWLFAHPFLTSHTPYVLIPLVGAIALPSAFLFDLGVFMLVVGATGLILIALAHQSSRRRWS
jgi:multicomponent K+:H+ antiporter subunit A